MYLFEGAGAGKPAGSMKNKGPTFTALAITRNITTATRAKGSNPLTISAAASDLLRAALIDPYG